MIISILGAQVLGSSGTDLIDTIHGSNYSVSILGILSRLQVHQLHIVQKGRLGKCGANNGGRIPEAKEPEGQQA
jgi:hypothetical protein